MSFGSIFFVPSPPGSLGWQDEPPPLPNGQPYRNTSRDWQFLNRASRNARYLRLVDPTALEDHRSAPPALFASSRPSPAPAWEVDRLAEWDGPPSLPTITIELFSARLLTSTRQMGSPVDTLSA